MCPSQSPNSSPYSPSPLVAIHSFEGHYSVARLCPTLCDPIDCSTPGLPCLAPSPRACSDSCLLSWWCHPTIWRSYKVLLFHGKLSSSFEFSWYRNSEIQQTHSRPLFSGLRCVVRKLMWSQEGENLQWWVLRKVLGLACRRVPMMRRVDYHLGIGFLFPALSTQDSLPLFLLEQNNNSLKLYTSKSLFTRIRKPDW